MKVSCPTCSATLNVDDRKIPVGGARIKCPSCQNVFPVRPPAPVEAAPVPAAVPLPGLSAQAPKPQRMGRGAHAGVSLKAGDLPPAAFRAPCTPSRPRPTCRLRRPPRAWCRCRAWRPSPCSARNGKRRRRGSPAVRAPAPPHIPLPGAAAPPHSSPFGHIPLPAAWRRRGRRPAPNIPLPGSAAPHAAPMGSVPCLGVRPPAGPRMAASPAWEFGPPRGPDGRRPPAWEFGPRGAAMGGIPCPVAPPSRRRPRHPPPGRGRRTRSSSTCRRPPPEVPLPAPATRRTAARCPPASPWPTPRRGPRRTSKRHRRGPCPRASISPTWHLRPTWPRAASTSPTRPRASAASDGFDFVEEARRLHPPRAASTSPRRPPPRPQAASTSPRRPPPAARPACLASAKPPPPAAPQAPMGFGEVELGGGDDLEFDPSASARPAGDDLEADLSAPFLRQPRPAAPPTAWRCCRSSIRPPRRRGQGQRRGPFGASTSGAAAERPSGPSRTRWW